MKQKINTFYILNLLSVVDGDLQQKGRMLLLMIC